MSPRPPRPQTEATPLGTNKALRRQQRAPVPGFLLIPRPRSRQRQHGADTNGRKEPILEAGGGRQDRRTPAGAELCRGAACLSFPADIPACGRVTSLPHRLPQILRVLLRGDLSLEHPSIGNRISHLCPPVRPVTVLQTLHRRPAPIFDPGQAAARRTLPGEALASLAPSLPTLDWASASLSPL